MKTLGNILWVILVGLGSAISWFVLGVILCITVIGIPFGRQCFKMAKLVFMPFGKSAIIDFNKHPIANVIWIIFFGWIIALGYLIDGVLWCITIIGIPFGRQCFKLAKLAFTPFGAEIDEN